VGRRPSRSISMSTPAERPRRVSPKAGMSQNDHRRGRILGFHRKVGYPRRRAVRCHRSASRASRATPRRTSITSNSGDYHQRAEPCSENRSTNDFRSAMFQDHRRRTCIHPLGARPDVAGPYRPTIEAFAGAASLHTRPRVNLS
jgi:hypothetical protein